MGAVREKNNSTRILGTRGRRMNDFATMLTAQNRNLAFTIHGKTTPQTPKNAACGRLLRRAAGSP